MKSDKETCNSIQGHEYVDLGLPSGLKWATCNVGANAPHEYGGYYAWGEVETKREYTYENCKTIDCIEVRKGFLKKRIIDKRENFKDTARVNWGGSWRMPTKAEIQELVNNCTWTWTTQNGVNGMRVTGPNGNSIFLPAAGDCGGSSHYDDGEYGYYWSSTPYESNTRYAYILYFGYSGYRSVDWLDRSDGHTVRPVVDYLEVSSSMFIWNIPD
ncbi:MAG: DUF1566 domain-containing protein [Bacteroidales bacterium]|nr:DUF1566 domain-containing protein [Bacteroidales bacterium]